MLNASDRFITFPPGLTVPVQAVMLVLSLEARGVNLSRDGDVILIRPSGCVTEAEKQALRGWKRYLLGFLDAWTSPSGDFLTKWRA